MPRSRNQTARAFARICLEAAMPVMEVYASDFVTERKADRSPVTQADKRAEAVILERLAIHMPEIPVIAEESFEPGSAGDPGRRFLLVDPVDGTKEFIAKNGEFTINIALVEDGEPVAGCVYAPALRRLYVGGEAAWAGDVAPGAALEDGMLRPITVRAVPEAGRTAVMSRSHADAKTRDLAAKLGVAESIAAGSSLKFCRVAEGLADVYPRLGPTMEWDTAAGHAVLAAAGGCVTALDGSRFAYGKVADGFRNGAFIAWGERRQPPLTPC